MSEDERNRREKEQTTLYHTGGQNLIQLEEDDLKEIQESQQEENEEGDGDADDDEDEDDPDEDLDI